MTIALALDLIDDAPRARTALHPLRLRILEALGEGASAQALARRLDLPRQRVNYHLRRLAESRLIESEETGRVGRRIDRVYRLRARSYLIAPQALAGVGREPLEAADKASSSYLAAVAGRTLRDLARLRRRAEAAALRVPTLTLEADVRFASPEAQRAFGEALAQAFLDLVARYDDKQAAEGRTFRFVVGGYPAVGEPLPPGGDE